MSKFDDIEEKIITSLKNMDLNGDYSRSNWTIKIKETLGRLSDELRYTMCTAGFSPDYRHLEEID